MNKKTAKQKTNANGKRGKAQNKHKTLAKEFILLKDDNEAITIIYPDVLQTNLEKLYYDILIQSCQSMTILFHEADKYQVAETACLMSSCRDLLIESKNNLIIEEENGNTLKIVKKINPTITLYMQLNKLLIIKLKELGLTLQTRADILQKVSTLLSNDVVDNKTAQSNDQGPTLDSFIGKHKINAN